MLTFQWDILAAVFLKEKGPPTFEPPPLKRKGGKRDGRATSSKLRLKMVPIVMGKTRVSSILSQKPWATLHKLLI